MIMLSTVPFLKFLQERQTIYAVTNPTDDLGFTINVNFNKVNISFLFFRGEDKVYVSLNICMTNKRNKNINNNAYVLMTP